MLLDAWQFGHAIVFWSPKTTNCECWCFPPLQCIPWRCNSIIYHLYSKTVTFWIAWPICHAFRVVSCTCKSKSSTHSFQTIPDTIIWFLLLTVISMWIISPSPHNNSQKFHTHYWVSCMCHAKGRGKWSRSQNLSCKIKSTWNVDSPRYPVLCRRLSIAKDTALQSW